MLPASLRKSYATVTLRLSLLQLFDESDECLYADL
jgi:hypothetical protein